MTLEAVGDTENARTLLPVTDKIASETVTLDRKGTREERKKPMLRLASFLAADANNCQNPSAAQTHMPSAEPSVEWSSCDLRSLSPGLNHP